MSSPRALANHRLYLARLLLSAWTEARAQQEVAARVLDEAFGPGCHAHLRAAYGWFLLNLLNLDQPPGEPPLRVADLPSLPPGRVLPAEIREFEQLEQSGWLAELLQWQAPATGGGQRSPANLASGAPATGPDTFSGWCDALEAHFQRMGDAIDEY